MQAGLVQLQASLNVGLLTEMQVLIGKFSLFFFSGYRHFIVKLMTP